MTRPNFLPKGYPHQASTGAEIRAQMRWLDTYTWIQLDGTLDFDRPRQRPQGLPIEPAEVHRMVAIASARPSITQQDEDRCQAATFSREGCAANDWEPVPMPSALRIYLAIAGACAVPALIYLVATLWPRH